MTTPKFFFLSCLITSILFPSCSSDDDAEVPEEGPEQFVQFEATGRFSGSYSGLGAVERTDNAEGHSLVFNFTDGEVFQLEFVNGPDEAPPPIPSVGEYTLGGLGSDADFTVVITDLTQGTVFLGLTEGELTISEVGATYTTGTFAFTTSALTNPENSVEVTDGIFRVFTPE